MNNVDLTNTYWDRITGYVSELRIDARWVLRKFDDNKSYGSLRIVSHPDLPPGYLRAFYTYVTSIRKKNLDEKIKTVEDYQMELIELEVYSIDNEINTELFKHEAPYKELESMFGVKIFE